MKIVDGELSWRKPAAGKSGRLESLAIGLGSKRMLREEEGAAEVIADLDSDEGLRWWQSMASTVERHRLWKVGEKQRWRGGGNEMREVLFDFPTREDNPADPHGAVAGQRRISLVKQWVAWS
jgi:hypothetical protein